jgi:hypothetical protein
MGNFNLKKGDILEVRIMDLCRKRFYKDKVNIMDKKQVVRVIDDILNMSGISIDIFLRMFYEGKEETLWH